ncbi:hypothetical protein FRAHR75_770037 [Frankia sp. Hr75.2]|nr:hypothetical protein FRAHR75_770037 [Frankia sp. Hr75.2]
MTPRVSRPHDQRARERLDDGREAADVVDISLGKGIRAARQALRVDPELADWHPWEIEQIARRQAAGWDPDITVTCTNPDGAA